jgi:tetratricopeptide (TPR) repeat protein
MAATLARLLLLCSCLMTASAATAQDAANAGRTEEAKGLFAAGRAAFDAGNYVDALNYFQRSYALRGRPELLYNIGIVHDRLRDDEAALKHYDDYLTALPNASNREEVEKRSAAIRAALATRQGQPPTATPAPTPAQTAAAAPVTTTSSPATTNEQTSGTASSPSVFSRWWFWTVVGAVVVGGITAGALVASGGDDEIEAPLPPKSGVIVTTLGGTR